MDETEKDLDLTQVSINQDTVKLERDIGCTLEILSEDEFYTDEAPVVYIVALKSSVGRYTLYNSFHSDFLELADPKCLLTGIRLHNILDDDLVENIFRH